MRSCSPDDSPDLDWAAARRLLEEPSFRAAAAAERHALVALPGDDEVLQLLEGLGAS